MEEVAGKEEEAMAVAEVMAEAAMVEVVEMGEVVMAAVAAATGAVGMEVVEVMVEEHAVAQVVVRI